MAAPKGHAPYPGCETGGRPKKYTEEFINRQADELIIWLREPKNIFFEDFLLDQDLNPQLMAIWAKENDKFSSAYDIAYQRQASRIKNGAITKDFSDGFSKFILINNHGYSDKTETKISGDAVDPLVFVLGTIPSSKDLVTDGKE